jgi:hypothetical protein
MYVKVINPKTDGSKKYDNSRSCIPLIKYLSKEDQGKGANMELYFNHDRGNFTGAEVIRIVDNNCPKIDRHEAKFYSLVIAPRTDEVKHLKNDREKLKAYVREVMDIYAGNFNGKNGNNKNLKGSDLVYFAKLEENRYYKKGDIEVKEGKAKIGAPVPGDNTHIHIIVSRQDKAQKTKLSPLANDKKLFYREQFKLKSCEHFDKHYRYEGAGKELEKHIVMRDGTVKELIAFFEKQDQKRIGKLESQPQNTEKDKPIIELGNSQHQEQTPVESKKRKKKPKSGI